MGMSPGTIWEIKMGKKDESGMLDMLMSAVSEAQKGSSSQANEFSNAAVEKQHEEWSAKIKASNNFEVGDKLTLNKFGEKKYNKPTGGQYAIVRHIFGDYQISSEKDGVAINASVDLAMFDKYKGK